MGRSVILMKSLTEEMKASHEECFIYYALMISTCVTVCKGSTVLTVQ